MRWSKPWLFAFQAERRLAPSVASPPLASCPSWILRPDERFKADVIAANKNFVRRSQSKRDRLLRLLNEDAAALQQGVDAARSRLAFAERALAIALTEAEAATTTLERKEANKRLDEAKQEFREAHKRVDDAKKEFNEANAELDPKGARQRFRVETFQAEVKRLEAVITLLTDIPDLYAVQTTADDWKQLGISTGAPYHRCPDLKFSNFAPQELLNPRVEKLLFEDAKAPWIGLKSTSVLRFAESQESCDDLFEAWTTPALKETERRGDFDALLAAGILRHTEKFIRHLREWRRKPAAEELEAALQCQSLTYDCEAHFGCGPAARAGSGFDALVNESTVGLSDFLKEQVPIQVITSAPCTGKSLLLQRISRRIAERDSVHRAVVCISYSSATSARAGVDDTVMGLEQGFWSRCVASVAKSSHVNDPSVWDAQSALQFIKDFTGTTAKPLVLVDDFSKVVEMVQRRYDDDTPKRMFSGVIGNFAQYFGIYSGSVRGFSGVFSGQSGRSLCSTFLPPSYALSQRLELLPLLAILDHHRGDIEAASPQGLGFRMNYLLAKTSAGLLGRAVENVLRGRHKLTFEPPMLSDTGAKPLEAIAAVKWAFKESPSVEAGAAFEKASLALGTDEDPNTPPVLYAFPVFRAIAGMADAAKTTVGDPFGTLVLDEWTQTKALFALPLRRGASKKMRPLPGHRMAREQLERLTEMATKLALAANLDCRVETQHFTVFPCLDDARRYVSTPRGPKRVQLSDEEKAVFSKENKALINAFFNRPLTPGSTTPRVLLLTQGPVSVLDYTNPCCDKVVLYMSADGSQTSMVFFEETMSANANTSPQMIRDNAVKVVAALKQLTNLPNGLCVTCFAITARVPAGGKSNAGEGKPHSELRHHPQDFKSTLLDELTQTAQPLASIVEAPTVFCFRAEEILGPLAALMDDLEASTSGSTSLRTLRDDDE